MDPAATVGAAPYRGAHTRSAEREVRREAMAGRHRFRGIATLREILGRHARPPVATAPGCTVGFADGVTGIAHSVTEEAFTEGPRSGGRYVALSASSSTNSTSASVSGVP